MQRLKTSSHTSFKNFKRTGNTRQTSGISHCARKSPTRESIREYEVGMAAFIGRRKEGCEKNKMLWERNVNGKWETDHVFLHALCSILKRQRWKWNVRTSGHKQFSSAVSTYNLTITGARCQSLTKVVLCQNLRTIPDGNKVAAIAVCTSSAVRTETG